jgi:choline dehydrogenase-like flavoprotein
MPGAWKMIRETPLDWNLDSTPQKGFNNRVANIPQARFLGGSSAMNGTVLIRGAQGDYDRIANMGNPGWSWNDMLPFFKASETFHPSD